MKWIEASSDTQCDRFDSDRSERRWRRSLTRTKRDAERKVDGPRRVAQSDEQRDESGGEDRSDEWNTGIDKVSVKPSFDDYAGSGLRRDEREKRCIALS